jgi:putative transposase
MAEIPAVPARGPGRDGPAHRDDDSDLLRAGPRPEPGPGQRVALFRYELISPLLGDDLSRAERGQVIARLCAAEHPGPDGNPVTVSAATLRRWVAAWRGGGFAALVPQPKDQPARCPEPVRAAALALKEANQGRTARMIRITLLGMYPERAGDVPSERTLQRWFAGLALAAPEPGSSQAAGAFGRFEAPAPMARWTGDIMHGPRLPAAQDTGGLVTGGRPVYLHAFLDDHSRQVMGARFSWHADVIALAQVLRWAIAEHGIPGQLYVDNGPCYQDAWLRRACAVLGIKLVHSRPCRPQGRGKIERWFATVRSQFLPELTPPVLEGLDLAGLNRLLRAWISEDYSRQVHAGTGQAPAQRFASHLPAGQGSTISPQLLREAFWWSATRTADKATAVIKFCGGRYGIDKALAGRRLEILLDPLDLTVLHVRYRGRDYGTAVPLVIGQHSHPRAARHDPPAPPEDPGGGTPYLNLLDSAHDARLSGVLNYRNIITPGPGEEQ